MSDEASFSSTPSSGASPAASTQPIDLKDDAQVQTWAKKLDTTAQQIHDAVAAVGANPADVEAHLKGTRSTTNAEKTRAAPGG